MRIKRIHLVSMLMTLSITLSAQRSMSLLDCMEYALCHSSEKEICRTQIDDALVRRRDALLRAFTPSISAGTDVYTNYGRTVDPETNSYISTTSFSNSYSVNAEIILFNGFTALNNIKIAKTAIKMGLSREQQLEDEICLSVMQAYYNVIYQREMMSVLASQKQTALQNLKLVTRQYELGQKGYADVVQMEADLAERKYQWVTAENKHNEALLNLKAIMLWTEEESLVIDSLQYKEYDECLKVPLQRNPRNDFELITYAQTHQPAVLIAKGEMENAKYALRSARGQFLPTLTLNGGWSTSYYTYPGRENYSSLSFLKQFQNNGGEYIQLRISFPLYNRLSTFSNLRRSKNAYQRATATYRQTLKDIENEVVRALQDCNGAKAAYVEAEKRLIAQTESYHLSGKKFAQGLISPIEYQTVSNVYLNAKAERMNAWLQYHLKQSVVKFYKGISYLEQQQ